LNPFISADFQNGKLDEWSITSGSIRLELADPRNAPWFYFFIQGVDQQTWHFDIPGLELGQAPVSISYDRFDWTAVDEVRTPSVFVQRFRNEAAVVSLTPPYTNCMLYELSLWARRSPHVDLEPLGGRHLQDPLCMHITDFGDQAGKPVVWVVARESPIQSASSWVAEGLIRFLLSPHPVARQLRRTYHFCVVPLLDTAGVAKGESIRRLTWDESLEGTTMGHIAQLLAEQHQAGCPTALTVTLTSQVLGAGGSLMTHQTEPVDVASWFTDLRTASELTAGGFGSWASQLYPDSKALALETAWYSPKGLRKSQYDLLQEGRQLAHLIGEALGEAIKEAAAGDEPQDMESFLPRLARQARTPDASLL
jgi:hypothetical protein